jgi:hypothetical protein
MRLFVFLRGALTSKPYAFVSRPWELESVDGFDFYDSFGTPIRFDLRGREVVRILPRVDDLLNGEWLADRTRFSYDAFRRQRLTVPLCSIPSSDEKGTSSYASDRRLRPVTWREALLSLVSVPRQIYFSLGGFLDLESVFALRSYYLGLSRIWYFSLSRVSSLPSSDFRRSYLSPKLSLLLKSDLIMLLGFTPRLESPLLHLRLRSIAQKGSAKVILLGSGSSFANFSFFNGGSSVSTLISILEGRSQHSIFFSLASAPSLLLGGSSFLSRFISSFEFAFRRLNPNFILSVHYSRSVAIHQREWSVPIVSSLPITFDSSSTLWLAEDDEHSFDRSAFHSVVYQGHHGDCNASKADFVFPVPAPWEKVSTFLSFQGDRCPTASVAASPSGSRTVYDTLRAKALLSYSLDLPSPSPFLPIADHSYVFSPLVQARLPNSPILPSFFVPYLADSVTRSSPVLALASRRFDSSSVFPK